MVDSVLGIFDTYFAIKGSFSNDERRQRARILFRKKLEAIDSEVDEAVASALSAHLIEQYVTREQQKRLISQEARLLKPKLLEYVRELNHNSEKLCLRDIFECHSPRVKKIARRVVEHII